MKGTVQWVRLSQLRINPAEERRLDRPWVDRLVRTWVQAYLGIPVVTSDGPDFFRVLDGQHRLAALREMHPDDDPLIEVEVIPDLTVAEGAATFVGRNTRLNVHPFDKFEKRVTAGDADAVFIVSVLNEFGLHLEIGQRPHAVAAVVSLESILHQDRTGTLLRDCLATAASIWGAENSQAFSGEILRGFSVFHRSFPEADRKRLVSQVARTKGGPSGLVGQAKGVRQLYGGTIASAIAEHVRLLYNKGLRSGALERG